jgi:hypothetical protein
MPMTSRQTAAWNSKEFGTITVDLLALFDWLTEAMSYPFKMAKV